MYLPSIEINEHRINTWSWASRREVQFSLNGCIIMAPHGAPKCKNLWLAYRNQPTPPLAVRRFDFTVRLRIFWSAQCYDWKAKKDRISLFLRFSLSRARLLVLQSFFNLFIRWIPRHFLTQSWTSRRTKRRRLLASFLFHYHAVVL